MFDHVADRDDDNKRASERGAGGTTRRTVDVHIGDIEGERGRGRGEDEGSFLPGWRIAFIITGPCRVKREGARAPCAGTRLGSNHPTNGGLEESEQYNTY